METSWPSCSSMAASCAPKRPQPMMITYISRLRRHAQDYHFADGALEDVAGGPAQLELPKGAPVGNADDDRVGAALHRLIDYRMARFPRLQKVSIDLEVETFGRALRLVQDLIAA